MWSAIFLSWAVFFWIVSLLSYLLGFGAVATTTLYLANALGLTSVLFAAIFVFARLFTKQRASIGNAQSQASPLRRIETLRQSTGREAG